MSNTHIIKEYDHNGLWYTVYYKGSVVDGFRTDDDAKQFAKWFSDTVSTSTYGRPSSVDAVSVNP